MSVDTWVRSQPKTLRPYFGAQAAENLLEDMELVLKFGDSPVQANRIILTDDQLADLAPRLYPKLSDQRINSAFGDHKAAFELVVTVRTPQMLRRELVARFPLDEEAPECVEIAEDILQDAKLTGLFEIGVSICLAKEAQLGPGWPTQLGSWVARETYSIGLDRRHSAFRILPLTEELIDNFQLPKGTFVYVDDIDDLNRVYDEGTSCATAYVSEKVLISSASGKSASVVAGLIWSEIAFAILSSSDNGVSDAKELSKGSPLEAILENLRSDRPMKLGELKTLVTDPIRLRAAVHDSRGLVRDLEKI